MAAPIRVLCLGNPLLADDGFGGEVARCLGEHPSLDAEVVCSIETGFALLDHLLDASHLLVVDTVLTGAAGPGTIYTVWEEEFRAVPGSSPHFVGLFETLALARALHLPAPQDVMILAVEAADCSTVGGTMHPSVQAAVPRVVDLAQEIVRRWGENVRVSASLVPHG